MHNPTRRLTVENHIEHARLQLLQLDYVLAQAAEMLGAPVPVPGFDPHKLYRCRDPKFHAAIHYTDAGGRHFGYVWQNGNPPFPADWDSSGAYTRPGEQHMNWDLVNYSTPDLDSSCGE